MTDAEIKSAILKSFKANLNNDFGDPPPAAVDLAVEKAFQMYKDTKLGIKAENINGDIQITYGSTLFMTNPLIKSLLSPFKKMRW